MGKIDLEYAKKNFRDYLKAYDQQDEKIRLKRIHTFCVVDASRLYLQTGRIFPGGYKSGIAYCPASRYRKI